MGRGSFAPFPDAEISSSADGSIWFPVGCAKGKQVKTALISTGSSDSGNRIEKKPNVATAKLTWTEVRYPSKNKVDHVTRHSDEFPAGPEGSGAGHPPE